MITEEAVSIQEPQPRESVIRWYRAGEVGALFATGDCHGLDVDGHRIGLFKVDEDIYAMDDICTHGNALLSDGEMDGHGIECPLHAGLFDVRDGRAMCAPLTRDARCHAVKVEAGVVYVAAPETK
jgi:nitrite reductase/ring-hydroxylating ferredoxin subunit